MRQKLTCDIPDLIALQLHRLGGKWVAGISPTSRLLAFLLIIMLLPFPFKLKQGGTNNEHRLSLAENIDTCTL